VSLTRRSASRAVFQQLDVPKKITVALPRVIEPSDKFKPWTGKFGLESSSNDSLEASFRSEAASTPLAKTIAACNANTSANKNRETFIAGLFRGRAMPYDRGTYSHKVAFARWSSCANTSLLSPIRHRESYTFVAAGPSARMIRIPIACLGYRDAFQIPWYAHKLTLQKRAR
jgi:hypothetical protein